VDVSGRREPADVTDVVVAAADDVEVGVVQRLVLDAEPRIGYTSDDMVVMQALVAAGLGVTTILGLALRAHREKGIVASELPGSRRHVYAATHGEPPDPPATAALLAALNEAAELG
jgi:DNA-binding transcriptional LysR family regulator